MVPGARGRLTGLLNAVCVGCKFVSSAVRRAGCAGSDMLGAAGSENVQGEPAGRGGARGGGGRVPFSRGSGFRTRPLMGRSALWRGGGAPERAARGLAL